MSDSGNKNGGGDKDNPWFALARYMGVGLEVALAVVVGMYGGYWADKRFGYSPLFLLVGMILGLGAAVNILVIYSRVARRDQGDDEGDK